MTILLKYHYRAGDIIRIFPVAKFYADRGHHVLIECLKQYHAIFECITYAKPVEPGKFRTVDKTFNPQIWPEHYASFRSSGMTWMDYVYGLYEEWAQIDRTIVFDRVDTAPEPRAEYGLPDKYSLIFPFAYSCRTALLPRVFELAKTRMNLDDAFLFMAPEQRDNLIKAGFEPSRAMTVKSLAHLPRLIKEAESVLTVNTSTSIIAGAVRKHYYHIADENPQDNWTTPNQITLTA